MRLLALLVGIYALFVPVVVGTALTYKLGPSEKACFYAFVGQVGHKVQSGGSFDVDYIVTGPTSKIILEGTKERQGDFVFTANDEGEYRFCFNNEMSTFAEKMVDFEIAVENDARTPLPSKQGTSPEQTSALEESIFKLSGLMVAMAGLQVFVVRFFFQGARKGYV